MSDSSVSILDSTGTPQPVDTKTLPGGDKQQTVNIGDGNTDGRVMGVDSAGRAATRNTPVAATSGTPSSVAASTSSQTLLVANAARLGFMVFNESSALLYLTLNAATSLTAYSVQVAGGAFYETPAGFIYTGAVSGLWGSGTGSARITEFT